MRRTIRGRLPDGPVVEVTLEDQLIVAVTELGPANGSEPVLAPGLIDIQVNGYAGFDVNRKGVTAAEIAALVRRLWAEGVTSVCPTVVTQFQPRILQALAAIREAGESYPEVADSILGVHVEGPYISPEDGPRGAHLRDAVRPPSLLEFQAWQAESQGRVVIVTIAPEQPGSTEYIRTLSRSGVLVAIGHTAATSAEITAAADAGARLATHLGNGCAAMIPRHPNHLWSQLEDERLSASLIVDGHHLPTEVVRVMIRAKTPQRIVLISDSSHMGGLPPGLYLTDWGAERELRPDGRICIPGTPYLAASSFSLRMCVEKALEVTDYSLQQVLQMATENPANLLDRHDLGRLEPGARADLIRFRLGDDGMVIEETIVAGKTVYLHGAVVASRGDAG